MNRRPTLDYDRQFALIQGVLAGGMAFYILDTINRVLDLF